MLSTAPDGLETNDPITEWPKADRIVCYCACPNHMSSLRAASLRSQGYQEVYALKEGHLEWQEREYPMAGDEITSRSAVRVINGEDGVSIRWRNRVGTTRTDRPARGDRNCGRWHIHA